MRQPDVTPYALYALQATEYAREHGSFEEFHRSAFRAYWAECRDIGSLDVVRVIAESNDLDWGELGPLLQKRTAMRPRCSLRCVKHRPWGSRACPRLP